MHFYVLEIQVGVPNETWLDKMEPINRGKCSRCPVCGVAVTSLPWLPPYRATLRCHGGDLGDIAFFSSSDLAVSDRFRQAWESAHLRGIDAFTPFERLRVRPARLGKKAVKYFHVAPRLFGTQVDMERSRIDHDKPITCAKCKAGGIVDSIRGITIDESSWTGEDMFHCWGTGLLIVTDRVRQLRDDHGLTNVNLIPVEEYFWDPLNKWTPVDYSRPDWYKPDEDDDTDEPSDAN